MSKKTGSVVIDKKRLVKAVSRVYPCVGRDRSSALSHILFEIRDESLSLVGANGFILGISSLEVSLPVGEGLMLHLEVKEFQKRLRQAEEVKLKVRNGLVFLIKQNNSEEEITLNMKDLVFPDWRKVFPDYLANPTTTVTFQAKAMAEALREVKQVLNVPAKLYIEGEGIKLETISTDLEKKEKSFPAKIKGESTKQVFDWTNLWKMVKALPGEITLKTNGYLQTALFEQDQTKWLMMPMYAMVN